MFFLFIVFWCWAIAEPCRGFEMRRQISRFHGIVSRLGLLKFPVRAIGHQLDNRGRSAFPCRFPAGSLAVKKLSLPGDTDRLPKVPLTHWLKMTSRQMNRAVSGTGFDFSLCFPVRQGKSRRGLTPRST